VKPILDVENDFIDGLSPILHDRDVTTENSREHREGMEGQSIASTKHEIRNNAKIIMFETRMQAFNQTMVLFLSFRNLKI
jgi:hypothetical protein